MFAFRGLNRVSVDLNDKICGFGELASSSSNLEASARPDGEEAA